MSFRRGLLPSTPAKTRHRLGARLHPRILAAMAVGPVGQAQLQPCSRMDQGQSGTCHAHSLAAAIWCAFNAAGRVMGFIPSPLFIASCTYADVQRAGGVPPTGWPPLQDTGAELADDATAVKSWGIAPMGTLVTGRYSDVPDDPPDNSFPEIDTDQAQLGGEDIVSGEYSIVVDSQAPLTVAASLDAGIPVWVGFYVDSAFEQLGPSDVAQAPNTNDPNGGGHAVYLSGYRTVSGARQYRLENSWGAGWADAGAVWCSESWLMACWDLWPMSVVS